MESDKTPSGDGMRSELLSASGWKDYELLDSGRFEKLERFGRYVLARPEPQAVWDRSLSEDEWRARADAVFRRDGRSGERGEWTLRAGMPDRWFVEYGGGMSLKFRMGLTSFKHVGLFPEQAANWAVLIDMIKSSEKPVNVLNLFAYTGGATVACASAGASVCHVDSARNMVERARENMELSGLSERPVRYIVDDCKKFVRREINRGRRYDALIMDPPSYGRGPNGELWKIEEDLYDFVELCSGALEKTPLFVLINSYTTGLQPAVLKNILTKFFGDRGGRIEAYEVCLPTDEEGIVLPCGASGLFRSDKAEKR